MSKNTLPLPPKHRLDVVDTALLRQKEKQALKWLGILLAFAVVYEGWDFLLSPLSAPDIPIPELNRSLRRAFPVRRIVRLMGVLQGIQQSFPMVRDSLTPWMEQLGWLKDQDPARIGLGALNTRLEASLTGVWNLFHDPIWEDRRPFELAVLEMKTLFALLQVAPPDQTRIPVLAVGPRPVKPLEQASRDLFQFGKDAHSLPQPHSESGPAGKDR
ncbi:MAG: hypothetical protein GX442_01315 [Candidatus Riflebacteria bacterium]|nr:hypothetical protein [Candidatus Riflebacteria bacterium]